MAMGLLYVVMELLYMVMGRLYYPRCGNLF